MGGSHAYGLMTPKSDVDLRGIFLNSEVKDIIGLSRNEHKITQNSTTDESFKEFCEALKLLRNANTEMIETLYNDRWEILTPEWKEVINCRSKLVDSTKLFNCLRGYMQGELKLANGERTGKLGGKRKEAIDKYGFSPKNFVQYFRLAWAGKIYFEKGYFPVNVMKENPSFGNRLMEIKVRPETFLKGQLNDSAKEWKTVLTNAFENRSHTTVFDEVLANDLCLKFYAPIISKKYQKFIMYN
jgi:hypothetical protein